MATSSKPLSTSAAALDWLAANPGKTQADAAREFGVSKSTIKRAVDAREQYGSCPCCGQLLKARLKPGPPSAAGAD